VACISLMRIAAPFLKHWMKSPKAAIQNILFALTLALKHL